MSEGGVVGVGVGLSAWWAGESQAHGGGGVGGVEEGLRRTSGRQKTKIKTTGLRGVTRLTRTVA